MDRRGLGLAMVPTVLVVRRALMVMVLAKVMAASDGNPSVQCPSVPACVGEPDCGAVVRPNIFDTIRANPHWYIEQDFRQIMTSLACHMVGDF